VTLHTRADRAVAGIHVTDWPGNGVTVLALPGLTSSGYWWQPLADSLPQARVLGLHLRGRGLSSEIAGPAGLAAHARDVAAVADELELRDVVLVGHSMGAYLAVVAARYLGGRVERVVLLDGGLPPELPWPLSSKSLGPRLTRLTFTRQLRRVTRPCGSPEAFADRAIGKTVATRPELAAALRAIMRDELDISADAGTRARLDVARAVDDAVDTFCGASVVPALERLGVPTHLLAASAGKHDRARPFLADRVLAEWTGRLDVLSAERVTANHVTLLFAPEVIRAVGA
jgi:pimeloyl-ACP methyl ester carboxylesterase